MVSIVGFGTYAVITPMSARAEEALDLDVETTPAQWVRGKLLIEATHIGGIVEALEKRGIEVISKAGSSAYHASVGKIKLGLAPAEKR